MEGNAQLPPQPTCFYRHDNLNQPFRNIVAGTTFPINISIFNAIKLYFTITRDNATIFTSIYNAPHLLIIPEHHNNHNGADHKNNNNREALLRNLHHLRHIRNVNSEFHDFFSEFHGLNLGNLPTLPSYIHITSYNHSFALHVDSNNTIYVEDQLLPIPPPRQNEVVNYHVINKTISLPLILMLLFYNLKNNTIMSIFVEFRTNNTIFISANSQIGNLEWAAILGFSPDLP